MAPPRPGLVFVSIRFRQNFPFELWHSLHRIKWKSVLNFILCTVDKSRRKTAFRCNIAIGHLGAHIPQYIVALIICISACILITKFLNKISAHDWLFLFHLGDIKVDYVGISNTGQWRSPTFTYCWC